MELLFQWNFDIQSSSGIDDRKEFIWVIIFALQQMNYLLQQQYLEYIYV
jgi:hypothetical protein